jgi:hypothetical protein
MGAPSETVLTLDEAIQSGRLADFIVQAEAEGVAAARAVSERRAKKKWSKEQFFIVFSPEGTAPPVVVYPTHKSALFAAWHMAKIFPGQRFFVMGSMSRPCVAADEADPDALTGCADDQIWADVPADALRRAINESEASNA